MSTISVAFRFHVNFYHSYRGDSLDEWGIGKDIRVIRSIIDTLDRLNAGGIGVAGTWDAENLFSLETYIPDHAPDILDALRRRSADRIDEIEIMSYNNGLIPAHTKGEAYEAIRRAITNPHGSGVADLFSRYRTIMRPQEMMYTPPLIGILNALGVEALSLYCSSVPFNTFGSFIPALPAADRFNPMLLGTTSHDEQIPLIPAVNHGDLADNLTLRRLLRRLRRRQLRECPERDLLVLIDMDADDEFWTGLRVPVVGRLSSTARGLGAIVRSVADLPFLRFTTPGDYLDSHPPRRVIRLDMDTADGSFDGYASWAEKWENHCLYSSIDSTRRRLWAGGTRDEAPASEGLLRALSTTHFGLAAPVMNVSRLRAAQGIVRAAARQAAGRLERSRPAASLTIAGSATEPPVEYGIHPLSGARGDMDPQVAALLSAPRAVCPALRCIFVPRSAAGGDVEPLQAVWDDGTSGAGVAVPDWRPEAPGASRLALFVDAPPDRGRQAGEAGESLMRFDEEPLVCGSLTYGRRTFRERLESRTTVNCHGGMRVTSEVSSLPFRTATIERRYVSARRLPGVFVETRLCVPELPAHGVSRADAGRLERTYDGRLREICPAHIVPDLIADRREGFLVWRQSYLGPPLSFRLPYAGTPNTTLDSSNNAIAQSWIAVSDGRRGILVAQAPFGARSFAFCPLRVFRVRRGYRIALNPFGSYWGRQLRAPVAQSGLGRLAALLTSDHLKPLAPSYAGRTHHFGLFIARFTGTRPPEELQQTAWLFSHPPEYDRSKADG